jgi:hypothetical protein
MERILTKHGERQYLGKLFSVSQPTVRQALEGKSNSKTSLKIRKAAIERGGVIAPDESMVESSK